MFSQYRATGQQLQLPSTVPVLSGSMMRPASARVAVALGNASISIVFVFNLDERIDDAAINEMLQKGSYAPPSAEEISSAQPGTSLNQHPFIQFRRVPNETFGIALFRAAAPAARAARAISGVQMFGKELFAQMDKRTFQLLEQWRFLRGKELAAKVASQGYEVPSNMMELVNNELNEQVNKAKGFVVESAAFHELRITRFQGLDAIQTLSKEEEDRIQDVLVRKAEEAGKIDKANAELRALISQLRDQERILEAIDREAEKTESESKTKRKFESKTKSITGHPSLFELRQLVPRDRDQLYGSPIDWESIFNPLRGGGSKSPVIRTLTAWIVRKVKDFLGAYDRELVEYILRRVRLRTDPLELTTDLRQYIDDEAEEFVQQIWSILVFETVRRQHCSSSQIDLHHFVRQIFADKPPSFDQ